MAGSLSRYLRVFTVLIHTYIVEVWRERYERYRHFLFVPVVAFAGALNKSVEKSEAKNQQIIALKSLATIKLFDGTQINRAAAPPSTISLVSSLDGNSIKQQYE